MSNRGVHSAGIIFTMILFELSAYSLIFLANRPFDLRILAICIGAIGLFLFQYGVLTAFFPGCDRTVLLIANFLVGVGLIVQTRIGVDIALKQLVWLGVGVVAMVVCITVVRRYQGFEKLLWPLMILSGLLLGAAVFLGSEQYGARNWISILGFSFQPSEFVKILLVFVLATLLNRDRTIWKLLLAAAYVGACVVLLLIQRDLGAVLLYALTAVALLYVATGSKLLLGASVTTGAVGAVAAYHLFSHVRVRVALWQNPWAMYEGQGYQVVQGLIAIATGGLFGVGLTRGMPSAIPARHTDYIFAVICEEFGIVFGLILVAFYLVFVIRGALIAMDARNSFDALLAIGCVTMMSLQSFIIIGGVCKLIPLTGITMPFVSYGGSSILSCFMLLGILEGIAIKNHDADLTEFEQVFLEEFADDYDDEYDDDDDGRYDDYDDDDDDYDDYDDDYDEDYGGRGGLGVDSYGARRRKGGRR